MKIIQIKLIKLIVFLLCFGSSSIYAGMFDLVGDVEFGLGLGFNADYWNIGSSKIAPRAGTIAYLNKIKGADVGAGYQTSIRAGIRKKTIKRFMEDLGENKTDASKIVLSRLLKRLS